MDWRRFVALPCFGAAVLPWFLGLGPQQCLEAFGFLLDLHPVVLAMLAPVLIATAASVIRPSWLSATLLLPLYAGWYAIGLGVVAGGP